MIRSRTAEETNTRTGAGTGTGALQRQTSRHRYVSMALHVMELDRARTSLGTVSIDATLHP
jgi:hypothetical protein